MELAPLPPEVTTLLDELGAPARLRAHLQLVHDVASALTRALAGSFPGLALDAELVRFGAATHDIGKAVARDELTGPGHAHETLGLQLLLERGVPPERARFARTHASPETFEDVLVALADKAWKGARDRAVEDRALAEIAARTGLARWEVFVALDGILSELARDADLRLVWQAEHPP